MIFLYAAAALFLIFAAVLLFFFFYTFGRRKTHDSTADGRWSESDGWYPYRDAVTAEADWIRAQKTELLTMTSFDGLTLRGYYLPAETPAPDGPQRCLMLFHGYHGFPHTDFGPVLRFYHERGYEVFYVDERAQNSSEGRLLTFGIHESRDLFDWVTLFNERYPGRELVLSGVSMGASTVLFSTRFPLPDNVRGLIADCGFTSPYAIIAHVMKRDFPWLPSFMLNALCLTGRLFGGFDLRECDSRVLLRGTDIPVLLFHGEDDDFVPTDMSREAFAACASPCVLVTVPGATHASSGWQAPDKVKAAILSFFEEIRFI